MPDFEVLDLGEINRGLRIEVGPGTGCGLNEPRPETDIEVKPPISLAEHTTILETADPDSDIRKELVAGIVGGASLQFTVEGAPAERHVTLGVDLAKAIITLKGLRGALVVSAVDGKVSEHLVLAEEGVAEPREPSALGWHPV